MQGLFLSYRGSLKQYKPSVSVQKMVVYCGVFETKKKKNIVASYGTLLWCRAWIDILAVLNKDGFPFSRPIWLQNNTILTEHIAVFSDGTQHIHRVHTSTSSTKLHDKYFPPLRGRITQTLTVKHTFWKLKGTLMYSEILNVRSLKEGFTLPCYVYLIHVLLLGQPSDTPWFFQSAPPPSLNVT